LVTAATEQYAGRAQGYGPAEASGVGNMRSLNGSVEDEHEVHTVLAVFEIWLVICGDQRRNTLSSYDLARTLIQLVEIK
jgi:hypothetical protein